MARTRAHIAGLSRLLASAPQPIYALDAERTVVYANPACQAWTGQTADELLGRRCDYQSGYRGDGAVAVVHGLCPPPEAFRGALHAIQVAARDDAGAWRTRWADCLPLGAATSESGGVLVIVRAADDAGPPTMAAAVADQRLHRRLRDVLRAAFEGLGVPPLIGVSPASARVREQVELGGAVDARVLVVGPPGSGRETIARAIHARRAQSAPLAPLDCSLLDAGLLESTIVSFTISCAELRLERPAALLLLDVDRLSADAQHTLAGIIADADTFNIRTLATARQPLVDLAARDQFRADLAFALSTLVIRVPPLAARVSDVPLLAQFFLERFNASGGKQLSGFSADASDQLVAHAWPGNGDELADVVRQACVNAAGPVIQRTDLPDRLVVGAGTRPAQVDERIVLPEFLAEIEKELLQRALRRTKGDKAKAARLLGVSRASLLRRIQQFGL